MRLRIALFGLGMASACANIAGIEAGHLRAETSDDAGAGAGGTANTEGGATSLGGMTASGSNAGGSTPANTAGTAGAGASGGALGDAGAAEGGAASGAAGEINTAACPSDMVRATSSDGYAFCIDSYEVTNAQYLAFTQAHSAAGTTQVAQCSGNTTFLPSSKCASALNDIPSRQIPVVCVDWCDAAAYCASVDKRLCGRIGGVENPQSDYDNANACEWYAACVGPDDHAQSGSDCNDSSFDSNATAPKAASQIPDCEGGFPGLFNLSGNVSEWENSCSGTSSGASCNLRGGSYEDGPYELRCAAMNGSPRQTQSETIGFRCCANAH